MGAPHRGIDRVVGGPPQGHCQGYGPPHRGIDRVMGAPHRGIDRVMGAPTGGDNSMPFNYLSDFGG